AAFFEIFVGFFINLVRRARIELRIAVAAEKRSHGTAACHNGRKHRHRGKPPYRSESHLALLRTPLATSRPPRLIPYACDCLCTRESRRMMAKCGDFQSDG